MTAVRFSADREQVIHAIADMVALKVRAVVPLIREIEELIEAESEPHCAYGPGPECPVCTARAALLNKFRTLLETFERRADADEGVSTDDRNPSDPQRRPRVVGPSTPAGTQPDSDFQEKSGPCRPSP